MASLAPSAFAYIDPGTAQQVWSRSAGPVIGIVLACISAMFLLFWAVGAARHRLLAEVPGPRGLKEAAPSPRLRSAAACSRPALVEHPGSPSLAPVAPVTKGKEVAYKRVIVIGIDGLDPLHRRADDERRRDAELRQIVARGDVLHAADDDPAGEPGGLDVRRDRIEPRPARPLRLHPAQPGELSAGSLDPENCSQERLEAIEPTLCSCRGAEDLLGHRGRTRHPDGGHSLAGDFPRPAGQRQAVERAGHARRDRVFGAVCTSSPPRPSPPTTRRRTALWKCSGAGRLSRRKCPAR